MTAKSKTLSKKERRDAMNKLGQKIFSDNFQYIINPIIIPDGYEGNLSCCRRLDAIVLPVGPSNAAKIEKYREALKKGIKRPTYKLGREDFVKEVIEPNVDIQAANPNWSYQFQIYDYAGINAPSLKDDHVMSPATSIDFLCMYYNLEESRIRAIVVARNTELNFFAKSLLDDLRKDGYDITITDTLVPMNSCE